MRILNCQVRFELQDEQYREWKHRIRRVLYSLGYTSVAEFLQDLFLFIVYEAGKKKTIKEIITSMEEYYLAQIEAAKSRIAINEKRLRVEDYNYTVVRA